MIINTVWLNTFQHKVYFLARIMSSGLIAKSGFTSSKDKNIFMALKTYAKLNFYSRVIKIYTATGKYESANCIHPHQH